MRTATDVFGLLRCAPSRNTLIGSIGKEYVFHLSLDPFRRKREQLATHRGTFKEKGTEKSPVCA